MTIYGGLGGIDWDASTWSAVGVWVTAGIYVAIGYFAWRQLSEAARLRSEQSRPFVVVDIEPRSDQMFMLTVTNLGKTAARNVSISFTPQLESTLDRPWPWELSPLFSDGIPTLAPKKLYLCYFDMATQRLGSSLPGEYEALVTYNGSMEPVRRWPGRRPGAKFSEVFVLDIARYESLAPPPVGLPALVNEVRDLRKEVSKWTDGIKGLQVHSIDKGKAERRRTRRHWFHTAEVIRKQDGVKAWAIHLVRRSLQRHGWIR